MNRGAILDHLSKGLLSRSDTTRKKEPILKFMENRLFIREKAANAEEGSRIIRFTPNSVQRRYARKKAEGREKGYRMFLVLKPRQQGITTFEQGENYKMLTSLRNIDVVTVNATSQLTRLTFRMVHTFAKYEVPSLKLTVNRSELIFPDRGTHYFTGTAGSESFGRSQTLVKAHMTEVAHWKGSVDAKENLLVGLTEASEHGEIVGETTANGHDDLYYPMWVDASQSRNQWYPIFIAWHDVPEFVASPGEDLMDTLTDLELGLVERFNLTLPQVQWRRNKHRELGKKALQEYPDDDVTCFLARGTCYFDLDTLDLRLSKVEPIESEGQRWKVWHEPVDGMKYAIGADCSEGKEGGDYSAAAVLDMHGNQCAAIHGRFAPKDWAHELAIWGRKYNLAMIGVERNNHGHLVNDRLRHWESYPNVYTARRWNGKRWVNTHEMGFLTDGLTREVMLQDLDEGLQSGDLQINDTDFFQEARSFTRVGDRYEGTPHDDRIFGVGIARQVLKQALRPPAIF